MELVSRLLAIEVCSSEDRFLPEVRLRQSSHLAEFKAISLGSPHKCVCSWREERLRHFWELGNGYSGETKEVTSEVGRKQRRGVLESREERV